MKKQLLLLIALLAGTSALKCADQNETDIQRKKRLCAGMTTAISDNSLSNVLSILNQGHHVNTPDFYNMPKSPLLLAIGDDRLDIIELLIMRGADIEQRDLNQHTPLYLSIISRNREVARLLIRHKANPNTRHTWHYRDTFGMTPLQAAERQGLNEIELLLRAHGAKE